MGTPRPIAAAALALLLARPATAQRVMPNTDSGAAEIRVVLRAFYANLQNQNWDALSAYVLSPKLLERRGLPGQQQIADRDRGRGRAAPISAAPPRRCPSSPSPVVNDATIRVEDDWAEASVPRCAGPVAGVDEFRLLYFESRWRFIYTDLFEAPAAAETARR